DVNIQILHSMDQKHTIDRVKVESLLRGRILGGPLTTARSHELSQASLLPRIEEFLFGDRFSADGYRLIGALHEIMGLAAHLAPSPRRKKVAKAGDTGKDKNQSGNERHNDHEPDQLLMTAKASKHNSYSKSEGATYLRQPGG